jgi:hypothetical protein
MLSVKMYGNTCLVCCALSVLPKVVVCVSRRSEVDSAQRLDANTVREGRTDRNGLHIMRYSLLCKYLYTIMQGSGYGPLGVTRSSVLFFRHSIKVSQ